VKICGRRCKKAEVHAKADEDEVPMEVAQPRMTRSKETSTMRPPVNAAHLQGTRSDVVNNAQVKKAAAKKKAIVEEEEEFVEVKTKKAPVKKTTAKKKAAVIKPVGVKRGRNATDAVEEEAMESRKRRGKAVKGELLCNSQIPLDSVVSPRRSKRVRGENA
jgi:hypothetical protein